MNILDIRTLSDTYSVNKKNQTVATLSQEQLSKVISADYVRSDNAQQSFALINHLLNLSTQIARNQKVEHLLNPNDPGSKVPTDTYDIVSAIQKIHLGTDHSEKARLDYLLAAKDKELHIDDEIRDNDLDLAHGIQIKNNPFHEIQMLDQAGVVSLNSPDFTQEEVQARIQELKKEQRPKAFHIDFKVPKLNLHLPSLRRKQSRPIAGTPSTSPTGIQSQTPVPQQKASLKDIDLIALNKLGNGQQAAKRVTSAIDWKVVGADAFALASPHILWGILPHWTPVVGTTLSMFRQIGKGMRGYKQAAGLFREGEVDLARAQKTIALIRFGSAVSHFIPVVGAIVSPIGDTLLNMKQRTLNEKIHTRHMERAKERGEQMAQDLYGPSAEQAN